MQDATLHAFRAIAESMNTEPTTWAWVGKHLSQRMFGITEKRAREYAARHGGRAMLDADYMAECEANIARNRKLLGI